MSGKRRQSTCLFVALRDTRDAHVRVAEEALSVARMCSYSVKHGKSCVCVPTRYA